MNDWEKLEIDCYEYLRKKYENEKIRFHYYGNRDSTVADILVEKQGVKQFYIEVKSKNAQAGQFVLLSKGDRFVFSPRNETDESLSRNIVRYMNDNYISFKSSIAHAKEVEIDKKILYEWIKNFYYSKGVKYFMTKDRNYIIFPVRHLEKYFNVRCDFRVKRSGSHKLSKNDIEPLKRILRLLKIEDYIIEVNNENKHFVLTKNNELSLQKYSSINEVWVCRNQGSMTLKCKMGEYEYQFREIDSNKCEVRKLSNTFNSNVIFSIQLFYNINDDESDEFENEIY